MWANLRYYIRAVWRHRIGLCFALTLTFVVIVIELHPAHSKAGHSNGMQATGVNLNLAMKAESIVPQRTDVVAQELRPSILLSLVTLLPVKLAYTVLGKGTKSTVSEAVLVKERNMDNVPSMPDYDTNFGKPLGFVFKIKNRRTNFGKSATHIFNSVTVQYFNHLVENMRVYCHEKVILYNHEIALLHEVIIDMEFAQGKPGGENIADVLNQDEQSEYYSSDIGFFQLKCHHLPDTYTFYNNINHLNKWFNSIKTSGKILSESATTASNEITIAITRYEYANIYHTMTDFYNVFLVMQFFNLTINHTRILLVDGHPKGALDPIWSMVFVHVTRIGKLSRRTKFVNLIWGMLGYNSPMLVHDAPSLPLVDEFRTFFLGQYRIDRSHQLNCKQLNTLFVWRRNYLAHPRNPEGKVSRKIFNERELIRKIRKRFPGFRVRGIQIDLFSMEQQLSFIANADILIGMHGAALTHALFLPKTSSLIELVPTYWSSSNEHFSAIARWNGIHYQKWVNDDYVRELKNQFTYIPPGVLAGLVHTSADFICAPKLNNPATLYNNDFAQNTKSS